MSKPFNPPTKEKEFKISVTAREAHLIKILRSYSFGKIVVYKAEGRLVRAEPNESKIISDTGGLDLAVEGEE